MPRVPKPAKQRQRRNRASTKATLPSEQDSAGRKVPPLPRRKPTWHKMVKAWWRDIWTSPMAAEYLDADKHALFLLAELHQRRWEAKDPNTVVKLSAEIRLQEVRFGLSPIDRRRLQWEVEKVEGAQKRTRTQKPERASDDPRQVLKAI